MKFKAAASDDMLRRSYSMPITPTNTASATTTTTTTSGGVVLVSSPKALLSASSSSSLGIIAPVRTAKSEEGISISSAHSQTVAAASTADTPTTRRRRGDSTSSNNTGAGGTPSPSKSNHATGSPNSSSNTGAATTSKNSHHKLDRYGFILNMDSRGNIQKLEEHNNTNDGGESESPVHSSINGADNSNNTGSSTTPNGLSSSIDKALVAAGMASTSSTAAASSVPTDATRAAAASQPNAGAPDLARTARRIVKWNDMLAKWTVFGTTAPAPTLDSCNATTTKTATRTVAKRRTRRHALLKKRLRKGIPDSMRATVWPLLCHVDERMQQHPGLYWDLVEKSVGLARTTKTATGITNSSSSPHETTVSLDGDGATTLPVPTNKNRWNGKSKDSVVAESASVVAALEKKQLPVKFDHTKSFKNIQETIERDIHRTFPRHSLFYSDGKSEHASESSDDEEEEEDDRGGIGGGGGGGDDAISIYSADLPQGLCGTAEISSMIRELDLTNRAAALALITRTKSINKNNSNSAANTPNHLKTASSDASQWIHSGNSNGDRINQLKILQDAGGQSRLRRVLKAYSTYDREIGYCQGMNFIAAMFLTLVSEEKAFWMLVAVMNDRPCRMRGLFGEGMHETHQVLYVSEKLIHQFLPRLAKHLDKETIHVTMFATQWLLTQYTSSFRFALVTRVWDCFLFEGWKITYRVMLSLLQHTQTILLTRSFEDILAYFRDLPDQPGIGGNIVDEAIKIPLRTIHIEKFERSYAAHLNNKTRDES